MTLAESENHAQFYIQCQSLSLSVVTECHWSRTHAHNLGDVLADCHHLGDSEARIVTVWLPGPVTGDHDRRSVLTVCWRLVTLRQQAASGPGRARTAVTMAVAWHWQRH